MTGLVGKSVLVVGGSSGIGFACARAATAAGAQLTIAGRDLPRLDAACAAMGGCASHRVDLTDPASIEGLFASIGPIDHLVLPGSEARFGGLHDLAVEHAQASMLSKFWGPYQAVRAARIKPGGSIALFSGTAGRRPSAGSASLSAINAAIEALGKALALELAPVRVNTVSPGLIADTGWSAAMPEAARTAMFESAAARSPLKRVGTPDDVAAVVMLLLTNPNITGAVFDVDAGSLIA